MSATPLPSSGGVPAGAPKTCDASGMAEIHRMFTFGFGKAPDLVRGVAAGDTAHAEVVATELDLLSVGGARASRGRGRTSLGGSRRARSVVRRARRAHEGPARASFSCTSNELDSAIPAWRASARTADAAPVLDGARGRQRGTSRAPPR